MRRVLIVAYYFPPLGGMGSIRLAGFANHLPAHGWDTVVLAPRAGAYHRDPDLRFPEEQVVRTRSFELSRTAKRVLRAGGDDVAPAPVGGVRDVMRRAARTLLYRPDSQVGWYPAAVWSGRNELRHRPVDAVLSSSFPMTTHLVGRRLAHHAGVPWIADFRDPWSEMLPAGGLARRRAAPLERKLAREASAVIMTSPSWAERHARLWGRPVEVIPNGHDLEPAAAQPPDEFILTYMGSFYPTTQDLSAVWPAIRRLEESGEAFVDRIRFIGDLHPALRDQLDRHGLMSRVDVTGFVGHDSAMESLRRSSALLLAGPKDAGGILRGQVAGKIPEYLATGLPIVYTGDPNCDAADLLRGHAGCHIVATGDVERMVAALAATSEGQSDRDVSALSRGALTGRLAAIFETVAG